MLTAGAALAASYTWTANGDATSFNDEDNWDVTGVCQPPNCFPNTVNDDALISGLDCAPCTIDIITDQIDDLSVPSGTVTLDTDNTLTVDTLTVGNAVADMSLTFTGGATVQSENY